MGGEKILKYNIDDIQAEYKIACESLYGSFDDRGYCFIENKTKEVVMEELLGAVKTKELAKIKYIDMTLYVMQDGDNVIIGLS